MSDTNERLLREGGLGFCCAITASLSHEINNVLAIVNELSGLLDDFLHAAQQGTPLDEQKLEATSQRIAAQVGRGRDYVKQLNQFAHTVDGREVATTLDDAVEVAVNLSRRFAALRGVEFKVGFPESPTGIDACMFDLQHLIFRCIDIVLCASGRGDVVQIDIEPHGDGGRMIFASQSLVEATAELEAKRDLLTLLVAEMRGSIESRIEAGEPVRLAVSLPRFASSRGGSKS